jgi:capsular exopolysaccharide synthesis family protein
MGIFKYSEVLRNMSSHYQLKTTKTHDGIDPHVVSYSDRSSQISETYRGIASRISAHKGRKSILVTSSLPQEGKTTTACNLAATFSSTLGEKTLLIDADLRRPRIHELMGCRKTPGLSDLLQGKVSIERALEGSKVRELSIITSGTPTSTPEVLLNSEEMMVLMHELSARFDRIIVDTPPVLKSADVQAIGPLMDFRIFIVKSGVTPEHIIKESMNALKDTASMPDTCLLTNAEKIPDYYSYFTQYSYRNYYSNYAGYSEVETDESEELHAW